MNQKEVKRITDRQGIVTVLERYKDSYQLNHGELALFVQSCIDYLDIKTKINELFKDNAFHIKLLELLKQEPTPQQTTTARELAKSMLDYYDGIQFD